MGKHFWMKHVHDETHDKQPGCMWRFHRNWHSNVMKLIHHRKYENQTHSTYDDANEVEKLLVDQSAKKSRPTKKRSLRARIKALIAEEISKESENTKPKEGFCLKSKLDRTYSIHHLESLDGELGKIPTDWNRPIIFLPKNVENPTKPADSKEDPDVLDIFKVDRELLIKHLKDADESVANFTRSALGLNTKSKFSKSRSFPVAELSQRRKIKPIKLENKQKEVWSFPREDKFKTADQAPRSDRSDYSRTTSGDDKCDIGKRIHHRSSSSNESLDKYAWLFENSFRRDVKLHPSKSLKLTNEYSHAPIYFRRIRSLSNVDSYYSSLNFEVLGDDPFGNGSFVTAKDTSSGLQNREGEEEIEIPLSNKKNISTKTEIAHRDLPDEAFILDSDICFQEPESQAVELQISEGLRHSCINGELWSSTGSNDHKSHHVKSLSTYSNTLNLENDENSDKIIKCCPKNDLYYVRHVLDQSGVADDASERTWHAVNQPLSPQLFEEVESWWPHDQDQSRGRQEFYECWHHQMLFDLVNEVLLDVYDRSLPYYPKALSSNCHVHPFPVGHRTIEDVTKRIGMLMNLKVEERQSLDCIVGRDLSNDDSWMNLQLESECTALELEDMIFDELLEEVICS
ncbi:hypothetical protein BUALT_Bualt02G0062000 [Buddleja alternifolia]|uniref:DUF4378 domain-containing protein n=1 Tax=Buddleja alternifolia TaxID=168488 RepID=A0AAV6XXV3_9LAMI|nr:hypothetical protein BUALT_Bualt02G0062000 [Buddleja alternifolia]